MKTSILIRKAINNHLSETDIRVDFDESESSYLCWSILFASIDGLIDETKPTVWHINQLPPNQQELLKLISDETEFMGMSGWGSSSERQQMRYMYADFLAYYFEDMGD